MLFPLKFLMGLLKLAVAVALSVLVVFITYRIFIKANTDFDEEQEIRKGNTAVGLLVAVLLVASANIIQQGLTPVLDLLSLRLSGGLRQGVSNWNLFFFAIGHLALAFSLSVLAMSFALRLFGWLTRTKETRAGKELEKGNLAIGIILAGVVFVAALYIGDAVNSLSKTLIPETGVSRLQIMR